MGSKNANNTNMLKIAIQQRVLPEYRAPFFDTLAGLCPGGLSLFTGLPLPGEGIAVANKLEIANYTPTHNFHFLQPGSQLYLCWQTDILGWLERWQPDVLVVEANPRIFSTRQAVRWMHAHRCPVLGWGLGAPLLRGSLAGLRSWERRSFLGALDGWIAYSQRGAQEYRQLGLDPKRVFIASNAVAGRPTFPPPHRMDTFHNRPVILFVGRMQRRKRVDLLLQACAAIPERPRLVIVGGGPDLAEIQAQAQTMYPEAEFVGAKQGAALVPYFQMTDLFVLPGTGGLAVQQAMTYALPVVVAQGDGTQDDLVRPENGWLIPSDDLQSLTTVLQKALADPTRLRRMGHESYRIVSEEVNLERMAEAFFHAVQAVYASGLA